MLVGVALSQGSTSIILSVVGSCAIVSSSVFFTIGCCILPKRMRQAVAEESAKYSKRSPTACTWQLIVLRVNTGIVGNQNNYRFVYEVSS